MVCYIVPLAATFVTFLTRKASGMKGRHGLWLNIMLLGGALFGGIDHLWNNELLILGPNIASDLMLGATITAAITVTWGIIVMKDGLSIYPGKTMQKTGIVKRS